MTRKATSRADGANKPSVRSVDPLIIAGGAAIVGAAVGALLPRSAAEKRVLAPIGTLAGTAITQAIGAARQTLSAEVSALPVVGPIAAAQIDHVIGTVVTPTTDTDPA